MRPCDSLPTMEKLSYVMLCPVVWKCLKMEKRALRCSLLMVTTISPRPRSTTLLALPPTKGGTNIHILLLVCSTGVPPIPPNFHLHNPYLIMALFLPQQYECLFKGCPSLYLPNPFAYFGTIIPTKIGKYSIFPQT